MLDRRILALAALLLGCESHTASVCEDQGDCAHGGDSDWIGRCKAGADALEADTKRTGCRAQFDRYYACADDHYVCHGATASFPGCGAARSALETCLARADQHSACAILMERQAGCGVATATVASTASDAGPQSDAGAPSDASPPSDAGSGPLASCTLQRQCEARCFLDNASNLCSPTIDELSEFAICAQSCPQ